MPRVVAAEVLDELAPDDPAARRSRRDLLRVHRAMGTRSILARGWRTLLPPRPGPAPLRILELGAGDGRLLLGVARSLAAAWPPVQLTLIDRQDIVTPATLAGFAALGWSAQVQVADVLAWAAQAPDAAQGRPEPHWDLISANLFLHHFDSGELGLMLAAAAARCNHFYACEPHRSWRALLGSHLVGAMGANDVTRTDAVLSVRAGFCDDELSARWPPAGWQLREATQGLFSHCFSARRTGPGA